MAIVTPAGTEDVVAVLEFCAETGTRWMPVGLGSNLLVSDDGFAGVVIRLGKGMDEIGPGIGGEDVWRVGAGVPTPRLARCTARAGMAGVHRLIGIPGTVGGGVRMNAGAHGQDFARVVRRIEVVSAQGAIQELDGTSIAWRYRGSGLDAVVVTAVELSLTPEDRRRLESELQTHLRWRKAGTPFDQPCCGSVFRNPPAVEGGSDEPRTAGQLIDAAGLKGVRIGGAQVSTTHANYIVNLGDGTAADVHAVIDAVRERVLQAFGVELQLEVQLIN
jgi:UDP-N-acetylmuramate dehydrogenase